MIFVTVGTAGKFSELIKCIDRLVGEKVITDQVVCQIGKSDYLPVYCDYYRFKSSIIDDIKAADLVITHGGATVMECLSEKKIVIAVPNRSVANDHQYKFLQYLHKKNMCVCCFSLEELPQLIRDFKDKRNIFELFGVKQKIMEEVPNLAEDIVEYLNTLK